MPHFLCLLCGLSLLLIAPGNLLAGFFKAFFETLQPTNYLLPAHSVSDVSRESV